MRLVATRKLRVATSEQTLSRLTGPPCTRERTCRQGVWQVPGAFLLVPLEIRHKNADRMNITASEGRSFHEDNGERRRRRQTRRPIRQASPRPGYPRSAARVAHGFRP